MCKLFRRLLFEVHVQRAPNQKCEHETVKKKTKKQNKASHKSTHYSFIIPESDKQFGGQGPEEEAGRIAEVICLDKNNDCTNTHSYEEQSNQSPKTNTFYGT